MAHDSQADNVQGFSVDEEDIDQLAATTLATDAPLLVVGIGGVGTAAVAHFLRRIGGQEAHDHIAALCVDTTSLQEHVRRNRINWIGRVLREGSTYITLTSSADYKLPLREWVSGHRDRPGYEERFAWYSGVSVPDNLEQHGAGAVRQIGRLTLARAIEEGGLRQSIKNAFDKLVKLTPGAGVGGDAATSPMVIVVSGTAGGTGAGMLLDMVGLLHSVWATYNRRQLSVRCMLAAPTVFLRELKNKARMAENAYALFKELDAALVADSQHLRELLLPEFFIDEKPRDLDGSAFISNVYIVDDVATGARNIATIADLHAVLGQAVYALGTSVVGGSTEASQEVNDAAARRQAGHRRAYSTVGSSRAVVPRNSLILHCARRLIADIAEQVWLARPADLAEQIARQAESGGDLAQVRTALMEPVRAIEARVREAAGKIEGNAASHDADQIANSRTYLKDLTDAGLALNRQKEELVRGLESDLLDIVQRGLAHAPEVVLAYLERRDEGLVFAAEALRVLDRGLEGHDGSSRAAELPKLRDRINALEPKADADTGVIELKSAKAMRLASRADGSLVVAALGSVIPTLSKRKIAEDYIFRLRDELIHELTSDALGAAELYLAYVAAKSTVKDNKWRRRLSVSEEVLQKLENLVREAEKSLRERAGYYRSATATLAVDALDGGVTATTVLYPEWVRQAMHDGSVTDEWYRERVLSGSGIRRLQELATRVGDELRAGGSSHVALGSKDDAEGKKARQALLDAAVEVVRGVFDTPGADGTPILPVDIFEAAGGTPQELVQDVSRLAYPTVQALSPEEPFETSTICVSDPDRIGGGDVVRGGTPWETLSLKCVHGHLLSDIKRALEWGEAYEDYWEAAGEDALPLHLDDQFRGLPEPLRRDVKDLPAEVFEGFVHAWLVGELTSGQFSGLAPSEVRWLVRNEGVKPVATLGDLPDLLKRRVSDNVWLLRPVAYDEREDRVVMDLAETELELGSEAKTAIMSLHRMPLGLRQAVRRMYGTLVEECGSDTERIEAVLQTMDAVLEKVSSLHDAAQTRNDQRVWQKCAQELREEITSLKGHLSLHGRPG